MNLADPPEGRPAFVAQPSSSARAAARASSVMVSPASMRAISSTRARGAEAGDLGAGGAAAHRLADLPVMRAARRDLRRVGDDQHLRPLRPAPAAGGRPRRRWRRRRRGRSRRRSASGRSARALRQTLSARRKRDSSPPEAMRSIGPGGAPGFVATVKRTRSRPSGPGSAGRDLGDEARAVELQRRQLARPCARRAAPPRPRRARRRAGRRRRRRRPRRRRARPRAGRSRPRRRRARASRARSSAASAGSASGATWCLRARPRMAKSRSSTRSSSPGSPSRSASSRLDRAAPPRRARPATRPSPSSAGSSAALGLGCAAAVSSQRSACSSGPSAPSGPSASAARAMSSRMRSAARSCRRRASSAGSSSGSGASAVELGRRRGRGSRGRAPPPRAARAPPRARGAASARAAQAARTAAESRLGAGEGVEERAVAAGVQQAAVVLLAVQLDQRVGERAQRLGGDAAVVDPGLPPAVGGGGAAQDQLVAAPGTPAASSTARGRVARRRARRPATTSPCGGAGAHLAAAAAPAEHEAEAVEQDRLAGAGLAGQHVEAGPEVELGRLDQQHVADRQRLQHRPARCAASAPFPLHDLAVGLVQPAVADVRRLRGRGRSAARSCRRTRPSPGSCSRGSRAAVCASWVEAERQVGSRPAGAAPRASGWWSGSPRPPRGSG